MANVKIVIVAIAYTVGIAGALAVKSAPLDYGVFGSDYQSRCVSAPETIDPNCGNGGTYQCIVYLEDTDETVPAYSMKANEFTCSRPLRRD
jgi:hypothetical protein